MRAVEIRRSRETKESESERERRSRSGSTISRRENVDRWQKG